MIVLALRSRPVGAAWTMLLTVLGLGRSPPSMLVALGSDIPSATKKSRNFNANSIKCYSVLSSRYVTNEPTCKTQQIDKKKGNIMIYSQRSDG